MNDRPTANELLDAVRVFLEKQLLPTLGDPRLRFQTLVAANVLAIAGRELSLEEGQLRAEAGELADLLGEPRSLPASLAELRRHVWDMNDRLCALIRAGECDGEGQRILWQVLRRQVQAKLQVANPRYGSSAFP